MIAVQQSDSLSNALTRFGYPGPDLPIKTTSQISQIQATLSISESINGQKQVQ